ncbi:MAG: hypothetical protein IJU86_00860 [Firmicutes bacterium]|nr:hypothetical protein [Bacillota bacterium]
MIDIAIHKYFIYLIKDFWIINFKKLANQIKKQKYRLKNNFFSNKKTTPA